MKVSTVIPVYNAEPYVEQAVRSALQQRQTAEVLLVEDGSQDRSLALCNALEKLDDRVRLLRHADGGNRGASASRNVGVNAAKADFVAFLDADDYMLEDRFEAAEARFVHDPTIDGVYDAVGTVLEGDSATDWWAEHRGICTLTTVTVPIAPENLFVDLLSWRHGWFCTDGIVVRRQFFERTGLFDTGLHLAEDSLMWRKMALVGRLVAGSLDRAVAMRRVHGMNTIIRRQHDDMAQNREMLRRLLRWCRDRRVRDSDRHAIISALVHQMHRSRGPLDRGIWGRTVFAARVLALVSTDLLVVRNPIWRRAAREAAGRVMQPNRMWRRPS